ncbi:MAG: hypothetical protein CM1200mP30_26950 [Pseudomonadota bacterium]|nr:MAG: hypothetical protein CM1200mP30_26950 [Pseudomonadota bacterium]
MRKTRFLEEMGLNEKDGIELLKFATHSKKLVRISEDLHYNQEQIEKILAILRRFFEKNPEINVIPVQRINERFRKYAIDLLEYFDSQRFTIRKDNFRFQEKKFKFGKIRLQNVFLVESGFLNILLSLLLVILNFFGVSGLVRHKAFSVTGMVGKEDKSIHRKRSY